METQKFVKFDVKELDPVSLKDTNGGFWLLAAGLFCTYVIVEAALNPSAHIQAFREGYAMAQ